VFYQAGLPARLCNRSPEGVGLHVVRETAPAVDLDHGEPFPVLRLERRVAGDVDLPEVEAKLPLELGDHAASPLTQVAARRVVQRDAGYG
jgi:hypothetical protein